MVIDEAAREIESADSVLEEESTGTETEGSENGNEEEGAEGSAKTEDGGEEAAEGNEGGEEKPEIPEGPDASEIAKLEARIELLKEKQPDMGDFYAKIDTYLSEEELALRFDEDQSAYIEAVEKAKEKFLSEHSVDDEVAKLTEELEAKRKEAQVIDAVRSVVSEYPDYDHQLIGDFFQNDLTRREQEEIQANAKDYADFFRGVYKKWKERNPGSVKTVQAPNIPDMSKAAKESAGAKAGEMFGDEEKEYLAAVGFRKI
ncbi:hypothetical protein [Hydrogenimonas sp.]